MPTASRTLKLLLGAELGAICLLAGGILWGLSAFRAGGNTPTAAQALQATTRSAQSAASPTPLPAARQGIIWPAGQSQAPVNAAGPTTARAVATLPLTPGAPVSLPVLTAQSPFQSRLYNAAQQYLAPDAAQARRVARDLNFFGKDSDPSNMCGPLSLAILRKAGLVSADTALEPFWLLNPREPTARRLLENTFPAERFEHFSFSLALNQFDWLSFPLRAGDFLYIYAGPGGTFEHMLVVDRVDDRQRVYAVTNHATAKGFVIDEVVLYDPNAWHTGMFALWTNRPRSEFGSTGLGGFELWRPISP